MTPHFNFIPFYINDISILNLSDRFIFFLLSSFHLLCSTPHLPYSKHTMYYD